MKQMSPRVKLDELVIAANQNVKEKVYWLNQLSGDLVKTTFPYDYDGKRTQRRMEAVKFSFPANLYERLMVLSKASERKLNMVLAAGLAALLYKYIGSSDIFMGTPIYRQKTQGNFINTVLILKQHIPQQATFKNLLLDMRQTLLNAIEHRDYPVEILAKQLNFSFTDHDDFPLFDVAYLLENIHDKSYIEHINCNMIFSFLKNGEGIQGVVEYNAARYEPASIKRIIHHFSALLETILFRVDLQLSAASMLSPGEKQRILVEFNNTKTGVVRDKCFQQLFEEQVEKSPDSIATVHDRRHITYRKLNELSNQLARMLCNEGVKREQTVGVMLERSPLMMVSILAVWKAGGAYVPIEPDFPIERIRYILDGSQSGTLLTDSHTLETHWLTFSDLQGLGFMRDEIHETGRRGPITNFNDLPIPHRSLVNYERYNQYIGQAAVKNSITLQSTRGCPYNCAYCHKIWPKTHVIRSAENLCHEVEIFYNMGVRRFAIIDDIFNLNIKNSSRFFRLIIEKGLEVQLFFPNGLRGDLLSKEYIDLMMEAGTVSLALALETASTRLQKLVGKNLNLEILSENIEYICREYPQVILELFTMHGFPTETREEAMMTMEFIKNYQWIHFPYVEILKIFPNTDMEKLALENGVSKEAILASENLAFHELPDTLPFDKAFTLKYQSDILSEYILKKERLLQVLPYQMALLTEDELVEKYNSYLPVDIKSFADLLEFVGIQPEELGRYNFLDESRVYVPDLNEKLHKSFPAKQADEDGLKVLLLDLSQFFSSERKMLYDVVEPPLGLMYLMTYLKEQLGSRIKGKIAKSRIDFDTYGELKELLDQFKPDVIGIRTLTFHRAFFHQSAARIRQWGIACPIIAGGPYATSSYKELLQDHNIDLAVRGEGELTLCELIKAMLENHGDLPGEEILKRIAGIAFVPGRERQQRSYKQQVLLLDEPAQWLAQQPVKNLASTNQSSDLAYIIYTSGSTGEPKGAMVHHLGMINHLFAKINDLAIRPDDIIAQTASICFDISVWQFLSALLVGAHPLIMDKEIILDPLRFLGRLQKEKVTILETVPSLLTVFLQVVKDEKDKDLKHLRWMILTGEVLGVPLVREWFGYFPGIKLVNAYGPTEASDDVTHYFIKEMPAENRVTIPIGKPVQNTHIYIMDKHSGLCPVGVRGEICVAGIGVGKGYLKDPGKTKKSFVANPLAAEIGDKDYATMYKTGDLGCYRGDGHIEIFGRIDDQVKIKGNRIELGEIENCLLNYDGIKESLVLARESNGQKGDKYLCAYVTAGSELDKFQLRDYLSLKLPDYMIPLYFIQLEHFPLTANGKIDRKALPEPQWEASETYVAPRNPLEEKVVELWAQVLEIEKDIIGIDSNFFELGGDSLTGTILVSQIHKALNVKVPFPEIFRKPQVRLLCQYIRQLAEDRYISIVPLEKKEYYPLSAAQKRMFILQQMDLDDASYNMMHTAPLRGWVDKDKLTSTFRGLIKRHESLRTSFDFIGEEPVQKIHGGDIDFKIRYAELDEITSRGTGDIMGTTMARDFLRSFDLSTAPLLRVGIVKINEDMSLIVINMHHIISDGASGVILEEDFMTLYRGHPLLPLKIQYKEYSQWQHSKKVRHSIAKQKMYWLKEFEDEIP
ncbi:MAG: AMP-binding protein, partial [Candidatus Aminicenantes bacterium]